MNDDATLRMARTTGIRDGAAFKQSLLELLEVATPVTIDISDVERVDTAALQLLFAFERDRRARGRAVQWRGTSGAFRDGATTLGLTLGLAAGADHGA